MTSIDLATLAVLGSWVAIGATIFFLFWQTRQAQVLNSANAVITLRERFDAPDMRLARQKLAQALLSGETETIIPFEVPRFFELIGFLTHRHVLDDVLVWDAFGGWITPYFTLMRQPVDRIGRARAEWHDPVIFGEWEWLYHRMIRIDAARIGTPPSTSEELLEDGRRMIGHEARMDSLSD